MLLTFAAREYELYPGESVLEGMARHGVTLPSACHAGACHTCLLRAVAGDPGEAAQQGLKPTLRARRYFLACLARPLTDLTIATAGPDAITPAILADRRWLASDVLSVWLQPRRPLEFRAGQHVTLTRDGGVIRTYSIANLPAEAARDGLQFHIRVHRQGAMSAWLAEATPGARIGLGVPTGECFYVPGKPERALLLAGAGTGIAPLLAIARQARSCGHAGPLVMVHAAARPDRLYLGDVPTLHCEQFAAAQPGPPDGPTFQWRTAVRSKGEEMADVVAAEFAALRGLPATAYLCGGRDCVASSRRALFMAGMSLRDIHIDEFTAQVSLQVGAAVG